MNPYHREILRLALPSIVSNVTVPLLGLVDLAIMGHIGSERYIAAISVGSMIFNVIYWLFGFLRMGTSGMTSQAVGRRAPGQIRLLLHRAMKLSLLIAAVFLILQVPLRWTALTLISPSPHLWSLVGTYFHIVIWGAPAMLGLYVLNGWFVGLQNTRIPMTIAIFQNLINIIASLVLVILLRWRIEGVATGTLIAQWAGLGLGLWYARRFDYGSLGLEPAHEEEDAAARVSWAAFFTVNRDIFLRTLCLVSVNLFFTSAGARQGDMMLAVNTLLMTFFTLFSYVMDGFAFAGEALSGRFYGAGDMGSLRRLIRQLLLWGGGMVVVFTAAYLAGGNAFLHLLTDNAAVIAASQPYLLWACLIPVAGVAGFIYDGIFIGLTATCGMLVSSLVATLTFFVLYGAGRQTLAGMGMVNHGLWCAFTVYLLMRGLIQHLWVRRYSH